MMKNILITAHSGCEGTKPNSMEYLDIVSELSCDYAEIDLRLKDGEIWLSHNEIAATKGLITLTEAVKYFNKKQIKINCDLKEPIFPKVHEALRRLNYIDKAVFSGSIRLMEPVQYETIREQIIFNLENINSYSGQQEEELDQCITFYKKNRIVWMNLNYHRLNVKLMDRLKKAGIKVSVWTVDEEEDLERMINMGVSNITTHSVTRLNDLLKRQGERNEKKIYY